MLTMLTGRSHKNTHLDHTVENDLFVQGVGKSSFTAEIETGITEYTMRDVQSVSCVQEC
jgi:hypothetical protein